MNCECFQERFSFQNVLFFLPPCIRTNIASSWSDFEKKTSILQIWNEIEWNSYVITDFPHVSGHYSGSRIEVVMLPVGRLGQAVPQEPELMRMSAVLPRWA